MEGLSLSGTTNFSRTYEVFLLFCSVVAQLAFYINTVLCGLRQESGRGWRSSRGRGTRAHRGNRLYDVAALAMARRRSFLL